MVEVAKIHQDKLGSVKDNIKSYYDYFKGNFDRWHEYRKFVFETSLSADDIALYEELQKPQIEFNILEAMISRLRGEFSKQEPSIVVRSAGGNNATDPETVKLVEGYLRAVLGDSNQDSFEYDVYTDLLSGGFSVIKVFTEYAHERSFDQNIKISRAFDPTLCGFDVFAKESHKGDGQYCFELYPRKKEEFEEENGGKKATEGMDFTRSISDFNWSYTNNDEDIVMVADYYFKKKKKVTIVRLADGQSMEKEDYEEFIEKWNAENIAAAPAITEERRTEITTICRYRLVENKILEYVETDYSDLPYIFVDGNSLILRQATGGSATQFTRPYVYHAKGVQKLKNFAGISLANELENMVQHKWIAPKEGIPAQYAEAYKDPQHAGVIIYNSFKDDDPSIPLLPPREVGRVPIPPEIAGTFKMTDEITQTILGSYDAALGINNNQLSGKAIQQGATQSNAAAAPYLVGFMMGLGRAAKLTVDLIPKYFTTPRTIPFKDKEGRLSYKEINKPNTPSLHYEGNALDVKVKAGPNFEIQRSMALQQLVSLMQASPLFAQFINQEGLQVLLDNIDIRGIDAIKESAEAFQKQMKQQQQMQQKMQMQQMQQAQQQNPAVMKNKNDQLKLQLEAQKMQQQAQLEQFKLQLEAAKEQQSAVNDANKTAISKQNADTNTLKAMSEIGAARDEGMITREKVEAENIRSSVNMAIETSQHQADLVHSAVDFHHKSVDLAEKLNKGEPEN